MRINNTGEHEVQWTKKEIDVFWKQILSDNDQNQLFFSKMYGDVLAKIALPFIAKDGHNLDYGCGRGYLLESLYKRGIRAKGLDYSAQSVMSVEKRFSNHELFDGAILSTGLPNQGIADNSLDFIFFIETIEHILPSELESTIKELFRILRSNGHILITTPNNENLEQAKIVCPYCTAVFHPMQHVNSFNTTNLNELMQKHGFLTVSCKSMMLAAKKNLPSQIRFLLTYLRYLQKQHEYRVVCPDCEQVFERQKHLRKTTSNHRSLFFRAVVDKPNLVYIGKK